MPNPSLALPALSLPWSGFRRRSEAVRPVGNDAAAGATRREEAAIADDPDRALTDRARRGDAESFRQLVDRHRDRAYAVALRIVRSEADAEEVAQDAFVRAWRALPDFRGDARFGTWLHAIVVRRALDRSTVLSRRRGREVAVEVTPEVATPAGTADFEAIRRSRRLGECLRQLNDVQRAAVSLYYYEDRSVEHVAEVLGMPENTVKTHLSRARAILRDAWSRGEASA